MTSHLNMKERVFAPYDGFIVVVTEKAIGIALHEADKPEMWLPTSLLGQVTYPSGDSLELCKHKRIQGVEIPRWLARNKKLIASYA